MAFVDEEGNTGVWNEKYGHYDGDDEISMNKNELHTLRRCRPVITSSLLGLPVSKSVATHSLRQHHPSPGLDLRNAQPIPSLTGHLQACRVSRDAGGRGFCRRLFLPTDDPTGQPTYGPPTASSPPDRTPTTTRPNSPVPSASKQAMPYVPNDHPDPFPHRSCLRRHPLFPIP